MIPLTLSFAFQLYYHPKGAELCNGKHGAPPGTRRGNDMCRGSNEVDEYLYYVAYGLRVRQRFLG